jgi:DNA adenine methylase
VVRHHPEALLSEMRLQLVSRDDFRRLRAAHPNDLTDIQRTARFVAVQRMAYGGKPDCSSFPVRPSHPKTFDAGVLRSLTLP